MFCPQCGIWNRATSPACQRCAETLPELERTPFERPDDEITRLRRATGNRYRVLRRLGGGGMADVYVAEQSQLSQDVVFTVMPFLEGGSLADQIQKNRYVEPARAATVVSQVACALDYAHRHGV